MNKGTCLRGMVSFWFIFRDTQINSTPLTIKQPEYGTQEMNTSSTTPSKLGVSNVLTQNFVRRCHRKAACAQSLERSQCSFNPVDAVCVDAWHLIFGSFFFCGAINEAIFVMPWSPSETPGTVDACRALGSWYWKCRCLKATSPGASWAGHPQQVLAARCRIQWQNPFQIWRNHDLVVTCFNYISG